MTPGSHFFRMLTEGVSKDKEREFLSTAGRWAVAESDDARLKASVGLMDFAEANPEVFTVLTMPGSMWEELGRLTLQSVLACRRDPEVGKALAEYRKSMK